MIDLFSILFSTGMLMFVIVRAIRLDSTGDKHSEEKKDVAVLNAATQNSNRAHIR